MRYAQLSAVAALVWLAGQPAFAQPSLGQIEQRLQGLLNPAPQGGALDANAGGYLGAELDDEGEQGRGVRVKSVRPGAPAEKSGLKTNDLITAIDGKRITNLDDYDANAKRPPNAKLAFTIERDGRSQPLTVTLGARPATPPTATDPATSEVPPIPPTLSPPGAAPSGSSPALLPPTGASSPSTLPTPAAPDASTRPGIVAQPQEPRSPASEPPPAASAPGSAPAGGGASLGIKVAPQSDPAGGAGIRARRGALIASVNSGSPADLAGLKAGLLIVQMDGRSINSDDDLVAAIRAARPGQEVELTYYDGDRLGRKAVRLGQAGGGAAPPAPAASAFGGASPPAPGASGLGQRLPGSRAPLINRVEQMVDNFSRAQGVPLTNLPTVPTNYDPSAMASLIKSVTELSESVMRLEERIKVLEGRSGGATPAPAPQTPGFGGSGFGTPGTGTSSTPSGPSFGPPSGAGTTNP
jgi:membrane-associated protease RseP (regulator of RpoE activity)